MLYNGVMSAKLSSNHTAMLLDHNYESAIRIRSLLSEMDIRLVEWSTSGINWLPKWQSLKPSITFVDLMLPHKDGFHCIKQIRETDGTHFPIFLHSYMGAQASYCELRALDLGVSSVLQKPFTDARFKLTVERYFENQVKITSVKKVSLPGL